MQKEECKRFLKQYIAVGIPHRSEDRPFFFYGKLVDVTDNYVLLERRMDIEGIEGYKQILLDQIIDIHINEPRRGDGNDI